MRAALGILGLVIALAIAIFLFKTEFSTGPTGGAPPKQVIDTTGVRNDLIAIAQAERLYQANHGNYASIDQLQQDGGIAFSGANRRGYNYVAQVDGEHFHVTASPADPSKQGWPTYTVDETMQITTQ